MAAPRALRILLWLVIASVVLVGVLAFAAWRLVTPERIRTSLEAQATQSLGESVAIGTLDVGWYPRVALRLGDVRIGAPVRLRTAQIDVSAGLRALLRRRIDDAELIVRSSRVEVPALLGILERLAAAQAAEPPAPDGSSFFTITGVRSIVLDNVTLVAGAHELLASARGMLAPDELTVRSLSAKARGTDLSASGSIRFSPLIATFRTNAATVDVDALMAFVQGALPASGTTSAASTSPSMPRTTLDITAKSGRLAGAAFSDLSTRVEMRGSTLTLAPIQAGLFGGRLEGRIERNAGPPARVQITGSLAGADVTHVLEWLGQPSGTVTGRLSADVQLMAEGDVASASALRGTTRATLASGTVKGLSLVRNAVVSFAGRTQRGNTAGSDRYDRIAGLFMLDGGTIRCRDLALASPDLDLRGSGTIALPSGALDLDVQCLLSPQLSAEAGRDLYRYAHDGNRIVLPATVSGRLGSPSVSIDAGKTLQRAIKNRVQEEAGSILNRLLKKPK
jgi:uncharacterized protein involved in outer membrane biogenesis